MAMHPAPEERGALENASSWLKDWWGAKTREQRFATMWRLWLVVLGFVVVIGGLSLVRRQQATSVNRMGRDWVEHVGEGASNTDGRGRIPASGDLTGAEPPALPGPAQPGTVQPGAGSPSTAPPGAPGGPAASSGGRSSIPSSR